MEQPSKSRNLNIVKFAKFKKEISAVQYFKTKLPQTDATKTKNATSWIFIKANIRQTVFYQNFTIFRSYLFAIPNVLFNFNGI